MKIKEEKKSAIKLINQYAEQYKRVELENKALGLEIEDLKKNLKISKDIIEGFFRPEQKEKSKLFLKKTKEEIKLLTTSLEKARKELRETRDKITYYEVILSESILKYKDSTEDLQSKIFCLENAIKKKDAIICYLNLKINNLYENMYIGGDPNFTNEVYLIEPTTSILVINNDLSILRGKYQELKSKFITANEKIKKLQKENEKLRGNQESDSDDYISEYEQKVDDMRVRKDFIGKIKAMMNKESENEVSVSENQKNWETEEWMQVLKKAKLTPELISNLSDSKIGDSVEILVKIIMEKNMQLRVVLKEINNLNEKNASLSNENISLLREILQLKKEVKSLQKFSNNLDYSISLNENDKKKLETSLNEIKSKQYKEYEKYLDEFNSKTQRIDDNIVDDELKECYKSFVTNDSTFNKKKTEFINSESFISETMRKVDCLFNSSVVKG